MSAFLSFAKYTFVLTQVLALISTFVAFGAQLISEDDGNNSTASWKWNEVEFTLSISGNTVTFTNKYDSGSDDPRVRGCQGGGQGLVGLAVLSLLVFVLLSLPLAILRTAGKEHLVPRLGADSNTYTKVELWCAAWHGFSFFCQCVIWGGTCMRLVKNDEPTADANVKATGFAYIAFCCALILMNLGLMWYLRAQKLAEGGSSGAHTGSADPTRFSSVYNQAATSDAQPAPAPAAAAGAYGAEPQAAPSASAGAGGATAGSGYQTF